MFNNVKHTKTKRAIANYNDTNTPNGFRKPSDDEIAEIARIFPMTSGNSPTVTNIFEIV